MFPKVALFAGLFFGMAVFTFTGLGHAQTNVPAGACFQISNDEAIHTRNPSLTVSLAQSITPGAPCTIMSYVPCNYFVPANDYVTFTLPTPINLGSATCPAANLRTVTITFEATPSAPLFVWLLNSTTSATTTPVYMIGASQTVYGTDTNLASWFTAGASFNRLCVQAIYPTPPPTTFFYPMSCMIVYQ